jgi:hypothetical protein
MLEKESFIETGFRQLLTCVVSFPFGAVYPDHFANFLHPFPAVAGEVEVAVVCSYTAAEAAVGHVLDLNSSLDHAAAA